MIGLIQSWMNRREKQIVKGIKIKKKSKAI